MQEPNVYFFPINKNNRHKLAEVALIVLKNFFENEKIKIAENLPIKIHVGEPGNISYIKPESYGLIIDWLKQKGIKPYFVETTPVTGERNNAEKHQKVAQNHGFTKIPFVVCDGKNGDEQIEVNLPVRTKHFKKVKMAKELAKQNQVLVISHFKGHIATGFGGAIKNLGIGFASRNGKIEEHSRDYHPNKKTINWSDEKNLFNFIPLEERVAEYALGASYNKKHLYLNFAIDIVENCDCDGMPMRPIYPDLGVLVSQDPLAIDKACFDLLQKKIGKKPFVGEEIFFYGEKIGLGNINYNLIEISV